jgi:hypothetical protein
MQEQHDFAIPWPVGEASAETSNCKEWVIEAWCVCGTESNLTQIKSEPNMNHI